MSVDATVTFEALDSLHVTVASGGVLSSISGVVLSHGEVHYASVGRRDSIADFLATELHSSAHETADDAIRAMRASVTEHTGELITRLAEVAS